MTRSPAHAGRTSRIGLAVLLVAASIGWLGDARSTAAAPAELISVNPSTSAPLATSDILPSVSGDGNIVVFTAAPIASVTVSTGNVQVFVRNRAANTTTVVPPPALVDRTTGGAVSRDGCHVAFWGYFTGLNLPPFIVIPPLWEIYEWDRCTAGATPQFISNAGGVLSSLADSNGALAISADGSRVAYVATSTTNGSIAARINTTPTLTEDQLQDGFFNGNSIDISDDGLFVALGGQQTVNDLTRNVVEGWTPPCVLQGEFNQICATELISVGATGQNSSEVNRYPSVSADGRYVAYASNTPAGATAVGRRQIYVRDRTAGVTKLVTSTPGQPMSGDLDDPEITPDGTQVALVQAAAPPAGAKPVNEIYVARSSSGYFDAAVFDLISYGVSGAPTSTDSLMPSLSSNGRYVAFASAANNELSGTTLPTDPNVWLRPRPIALDITPTIDFGTLDIGVQSAPQNAVVTNTSNVAINIAAVTPPAAPFTLTANTCNGPLPAGATCTVTMVFTPTGPGAFASSVAVSGDGLSVSASVSGNGKSTIVPGSLTIKPKSASYGSAPIGTVVPPKKFVVTNPGQTAVPLAGAALSGVAADQFAITSSTCTGSLGPGASCTIQVGATIIRGGSESATLAVLGTGGQSTQATLRLGGIFTPTLTMNPGVVSPNGVTTAIGAGFPPEIDVELAFDGEGPFAVVHTDAAGAFRFDFFLLPHSVRIGGRQVLAVDQPDFTGVFAPLLIELATSRPSGFSNPEFFSGVRTLLTRGG